MSGRSGDDLFGLYLHDIRAHPLLTPEDERRLGTVIAAGRAAEARLADGRGIGPGARGELSRQVDAGRQASREFVEANLRLVVSIAARYRWSRLSPLDLVQAGNIALMHAVATFDPRRGLRFSTYASWIIRMAVGREILTNGHAIRLPVHVAQHLAVLRRASRELELVLAREPTVTELSEALGWPAAEVTDLLALPSDPTSLDDVRDAGEGRAAADMVSDPGAPDPADVVVSGDDVAARVDRMLDELDEPERTVLVLRYGLRGETPTGWDDLARRLSVRRTDVRRIAHHGVARMRRSGSWRVA